MTSLNEWLLSGRAVDFALVVTALEFAVLICVRRATLRGLSAVNLIRLLLPGICLLLALRVALTSGNTGVIALLLFLALLSHLFELQHRWRSA
jgi:hypothetical protein